VTERAGAITGEARAVDELRTLGEELRDVLAHERRAISALDHAALAFLASRKQDLAERLARARDAAGGLFAPEVKALFETLRAEAHATAMLAHTASTAVRALLGREHTGYDRHARRTETARLRLLATY
jgi:hypothetical protein